MLCDLRAQPRFAEQQENPFTAKLEINEQGQYRVQQACIQDVSKGSKPYIWDEVSWLGLVFACSF